MKIDYSELRFWIGSLEDYFSELLVESPSLELIELTISRYGVAGSWLETLKWEKQS